MVKGYDYRPELVSKDYSFDKINSYNNALEQKIKNDIFLENKNNKQDSKNKIMDMTLNDFYDKIINILPNLYNDYHKKYLEMSLSLKNEDEYVSDNVIVRETIKYMIFNNENMIYLGVILILISFLLYMINL